MKRYQIRYNTAATSEKDRWRVLDDTTEYKVKDVVIKTSSFTTKDNIAGIGEKHHISCKGELRIKGGVAYISSKEPDNSIKRHIAKTISYRLISTTIGFLTMWAISGQIEIGAAFGAIELVYKPMQYYIHERIWYKYIKLGRKKD